jgi:hypothetical protein
MQYNGEIKILEHNKVLGQMQERTLMADFEFLLSKFTWNWWNPENVVQAAILATSIRTRCILKQRYFTIISRHIVILQRVQS